MTRHVALLRGVNVGGGNKVPMAALRALAEGLGWTGVQSYIASGNLVFSAEGAVEVLASDLRRAMVAGMGVDVPVLVLPGAALREAMAACPWPEAEGKRVHALFPWGPVAVDQELCADLSTAGEELVAGSSCLWLHTPDGFGTSKLAEKLPRVVRGAEMTARNLNTLRKLVELLDG